MVSSSVSTDGFDGWDSCDDDDDDHYQQQQRQPRRRRRRRRRQEQEQEQEQEPCRSDGSDGFFDLAGVEYPLGCQIQGQQCWIGWSRCCEVRGPGETGGDSEKIVLESRARDVCRGARPTTTTTTVRSTRSGGGGGGGEHIRRLRLDVVVSDVVRGARGGSSADFGGDGRELAVARGRLLEPPPGTATLCHPGDVSWSRSSSGSSSSSSPSGSGSGSYVCRRTTECCNGECDACESDGAVPAATTDQQASSRRRLLQRRSRSRSRSGGGGGG